MILRSLRNCSGCRPKASNSRTKYAAFYLRFYSVVTAFKEQELEDYDHDSFHVAAPIKAARDLTLVLPKARQQRLPKRREERDLASATKLETALFSTARLLKSIDETIARCKRELDVAYDAKARRRRELQGHQAHEIVQTDPKISELQRDIEFLETILNNDKLTVRPSAVIKVPIPRITKSRSSSKVLDNRIHNLLRLPARNQLSNLALLLSTTSVAPSRKTFNILISRLTKLRQNAAAWIIFRAMLRLDLEPDEYTIASVLNLCIVSGSYMDFCSVLLASRAQRKIAKSNGERRGRRGRGLVLLSTIIKGCIKFRKFRQAEIYYKLMWSEKAKPNLEVMTAMIQGYREMKDWERGRLVLHRLLLLQEWDRKLVVTLLSYCRACGQPLFEARIREVAILKGVFVRFDENMATLPPAFKTKGLDVPNHFKRPGPGDVGALHPENIKTKAKLRQSLEEDKPFVGTRRVALGKWA